MAAALKKWLDSIPFGEVPTDNEIFCFLDACGIGKKLCAKLLKDEKLIKGGCLSVLNKKLVKSGFNVKLVRSCCFPLIKHPVERREELVELVKNLK